MRKITLALSAIALVIGLNHSVQAKISTDTPLNAGVTVAQLAHQMPIHWVSVEQIENSLQGIPAMAVGFDIDDTVLFSSPGFYRGQKEYSPQDQSYLKNPEFWEKMNNGWDSFSMPKQVGKDLIAMHLKRGDSIYFITGRSPTKTETVTETLRDDFSIPAASMNSVVFAGDLPGQNTKVNWIKDKKIKIYYGDSDGDINAARDVGIRGIRVLRASNSSYQPLPKAGALGEEVIVNSEY